MNCLHIRQHRWILNALSQVKKARLKDYMLCDSMHLFDNLGKSRLKEQRTDPEEISLGGSFNTWHGKRGFGRTRELFCILLVMAGTWFLRLPKCFNLKIYEIKNKGKWSWAGTDPLLLCSSFTFPSAIPRDKSEPHFLEETEQGGTGLVFPDSTPLYFYTIRSFQFIYSFS